MTVPQFKQRIRRRIWRSCSQRLKASVSFSQCGEDLIIRYIFNSLGIATPTYLDVGAHHPYELSNTALFHLDGSHGINIEPNPDLFARFPLVRPGDLNLNIGLAAQPGEMPFYVLSDSSLSSFCHDEVQRLLRECPRLSLIATKQIRVDTISNVVHKHAGNVYPDLLSVDAEGIDDLIISSLSARSANLPTVICVETLSYAEDRSGQKNSALISHLVETGYLNYADTHINTIFVLEREWRSPSRRNRGAASTI